MKTALLIVVALTPALALAQPLPQPKVGQCPSGYRESGGYCAPTSDRAAIPKRGQCPSGWAQSGQLLHRDAAALTLAVAFIRLHRTTVCAGMHYCKSDLL